MQGWLFVDKPKGWLSTKVVNIIKRQVYPYKVGHGGTLDPMAEGVLPIAIGEATKTISFVLNSDKVYTFTIKFGIKTDTKDAEGKIIATNDLMPSKLDIINILPNFLGNILQYPPIFSAIKIHGERAYNKARKGEEVILNPRMVSVFTLDLISFNEQEKIATFKSKVSKGTYIRSLAEDIAEKLNSLGHIIYLRRENFCLNKEIVLIDENMIYNIDKYLDKSLLSMEYMLDGILAYISSNEEVIKILHGNFDFLKSKLDQLPQGIFKILHNNKIIALMENINNNLICLRVFNKQF